MVFLKVTRNESGEFGGRLLYPSSPRPINYHLRNPNFIGRLKKIQEVSTIFSFLNWLLCYDGIKKMILRIVLRFAYFGSLGNQKVWKQRSLAFLYELRKKRTASYSAYVAVKRCSSNLDRWDKENVLHLQLARDSFWCELLSCSSLVSLHVWNESVPGCSLSKKNKSKIRKWNFLWPEYMINKN